MSELRWDAHGVQVSTYAGPETDRSISRKRVQIHCDGTFVTLTMEQWLSIVRYVSLVGADPYGAEWIDDEYAIGISVNGILYQICPRDMSPIVYP